MNIAIRLDNSKIGQALAGKVSLVTGSTSGIGLGIARALAAAGSEIFLNGFGKPQEVADVEELGALAVFLASDAAASITGIALPVDGGWTAH